MIYALGGLTLLYLLTGMVVVGKMYIEVKDEADARNLPRWYTYVNHVMLWLPNRILRKRS